MNFTRNIRNKVDILAHSIKCIEIKICKEVSQIKCMLNEKLEKINKDLEILIKSQLQKQCKQNWIYWHAILNRFRQSLMTTDHSSDIGNNRCCFLNPTLLKIAPIFFDILMTKQINHALELEM